MERRKQASELLQWKRDLDAEEEKVLELERSALEAWQGRPEDRSDAEDTHNKGNAHGDRWNWCTSCLSISGTGLLLIADILKDMIVIIIIMII